MQLGEREQLVAFRAPNTNVDILNDFIIEKIKEQQKQNNAFVRGF